MIPVTCAPKVKGNCLESEFGKYIKKADAGQDMAEMLYIEKKFCHQFHVLYVMFLDLVSRYVEDYPRAAVKEKRSHDIRIKVLVAL